MPRLAIVKYILKFSRLLMCRTLTNKLKMSTGWVNPKWQQVMCDISQRRLLELSTLPSDLGSGTQGPLSKSGRVRGGTGSAPQCAGWLGCSGRLREGVILLLLRLPPEYWSSCNHTGNNRAYQNVRDFEEAKYWGFKLSRETKLKSEFGCWPRKKISDWRVKWGKTRLDDFLQ